MGQFGDDPGSGPLALTRSEFDGGFGAFGHQRCGDVHDRQRIPVVERPERIHRIMESNYHIRSNYGSGIL